MSVRACTVRRLCARVFVNCARASLDIFVKLRSCRSVRSSADITTQVQPRSGVPPLPPRIETPLPAARRTREPCETRLPSPVVRPKAAARAAQESPSDVAQKVSNVADHAVTSEAPIGAELGSTEAEVPSTVPEQYGDEFEGMISLLAAEYDSIRKTMPASEERTTRMTAMVRKARNLAGRMPNENLPLQLFVRSGSAGERIVALALAQASPKQAYFPIALGGIAHAESAFEQFQALSLARWLFDSLNPEQREQLRSALLEQETVKIDQQDSSRWRQREELLTKLGGGSTPAAAAMA